MIGNERRVQVARLGAIVLGVCAASGALAGAAWAAPGWTAYVVDSTGGTVTTIDTATNTTFGTAMIVGAGPVSVAITPDGRTAYVTSSAGAAVWPIDVATRTPQTLINIPTPRGIAITPDGKTAYVTSAGDGKVFPVNLATSTVGTGITVGLLPDGIAITPDGRTAYVANTGGTTVTPINLTTNAAAAAITVGTSPEGIAITPDGRTALVTNRDSASVSPIDIATNTAGTPITVGAHSRGIAITPDGRTAYATSETGGTVTPIDLATRTAGSAIGVGTNPEKVAFTPDGRIAYVTNIGSGTVSPINTATNNAGTPITVGPHPFGVVVAPDQAPTAAFTVTPGTAGSPSTFDGSPSASAVGSIAAHEWDFGDGQRAATSAATTTHTYATPGTYSARLTVTNSAGNSLAQRFTGQTVSLQGGPQASTTRTVTVAEPPIPVVPAPAPTPTPALTLTHLTQSHSTWRAGSRLAGFAKTTRKRSPVGTTFSFTLSEQARVSLAFTQRVRGRKVNAKCVAQTTKNAKRPSCTRTVTRGTLAFTGKAGVTKLRFQGRISASRRLARGRHTLTISAAAAGRRSPAKSLSFTIVR